MSISTIIVLMFLLGVRPEVPSSWNSGILAVDQETGEILVAVNPDTPLRPASTVKAVTTLSALSNLGSSHVYLTTIEIDTLSNSLYLIGSGAPLLSIEDVTRAAMETAAMIDGETTWQVYLDPTAITGEQHLPGWAESDWNRTYCPPVESLCVGDNVLEIVVSSIDGVIKLFTYPTLPSLNINRSSLAIGRTSNVTAVGGNWETNEPEMRISGTIANGEREILYKPFAGAPSELAQVLCNELTYWGISVSYAGVREVSSDLQTTAVMYSDPLWVILGSMNKWSRNIVAEQILRTIAHETTGEPGSTRAGCDISGALLESLTTSPAGWQLADGSGLSRHNLLTARQLVAVFRKGSTSLEFGPEFMASFPVNGVDGTLYNRMSDLPAGAFRGKTGSLNDTCTIAGILTSQSGKKIALAIFLEFPSGNIWRARAWQDRYIEDLYYSY